MPHPDLGELFRDARGRRYWFLAEKPGQVAFMVEGRSLQYVWCDKEELKRLRRHVPPRDPTPLPLWWDEDRELQIRSRPDITINRAVTNWNNWWGLEIGKKGGLIRDLRFYIVPMRAIVRSFWVVDPLERVQVLLGPDLV